MFHRLLRSLKELLWRPVMCLTIINFQRLQDDRAQKSFNNFFKKHFSANKAAAHSHQSYAQFNKSKLQSVQFFFNCKSSFTKNFAPVK
jgi:hypothetical protein